MADDNVHIGINCQLKSCFKLLEQYSWLLDAYVLNFFTESHWKRLPTSWQEYLEKIPLEDMHLILNTYQNKYSNITPLSLMCVRILLQNLALPRQLIGSEKASFTQCIDKNKLNVTLIRGKSKSPEIFKYPKLGQCFLKHVKPKKRYEIFKMAEITAEIANRLKVHFIVDIGSGLGHLSRVLAYGFNLYVCSIETQLQLTKQAKKLDLEFEIAAGNHLSDCEIKNLKKRSPIQLNQTVKSNFEPTKFVQDIKTAFSVDDNNFKFGIVGLHPCGDLAALLLKLYAECSEARFINLVGCCYHKLTTNGDIPSNFGFPLSKFCSGIFVDISTEARALACHAIETYCERLKTKKYDHLKVHCYRATLEKLIEKNWPHLRKSALCSVKAGPELDFNQYCKMALKKLDLTISKEDLNSTEIQKNLSQWKDVVKYYSLRLMLAPLIETVILLDRKMYLLEIGIPVKIVAAFDPSISPRNQLLLSEKTS